MAHWELLATAKLTGTSDTLIDTSITEKNFLWIQEIKIPSGNARSKYEFNSDGGSNYSERNSDNEYIGVLKPKFLRLSIVSK